MTTTTTTTERRVTCSVIGRHSGNRCTAQALDETAEVLICQRHAALVLEMIQARLTARATPEKP